METTVVINGETLAVDQFCMLTEIKDMTIFPFEIKEHEMYIDHLGTMPCSGTIYRFESDSPSFDCVMQDDDGGLFLCKWAVQKSNNEI